MSSVFIIKEVHARRLAKSRLAVSLALDVHGPPGSLSPIDENQRIRCWFEATISPCSRVGTPGDFQQEDLFNFSPGVPPCRLSEARDTSTGSVPAGRLEKHLAETDGEKEKKRMEKAEREEKMGRKEESGPMSTQTRGGPDRFSLSFPEITGVCVVYLAKGAIVLGRIGRGNLVNVHAFVFPSS